MDIRQHTLASSFHLSGVGLHTGTYADIEIVPAQAGHGIQFQRIDLPQQPIIAADINLVSSLERSTTIADDQCKVITVEHCLAGLMGMKVDNALIKINGPEVPILDGSAKPFIDEIQKVGLCPQPIEREFIEIQEELFYENKEKGISLHISPHHSFEIDVHIAYNTSILSNQKASLTKMEDFASQIAPARTFCFLHELEMLFRSGLIKGGDISNAVVFVDQKVEEQKLAEIARLLHKPKLKVNDKGFLNNTTLRFDNEPARHKLLDVIGDLALLGKPIKGKVIAHKPGHAANVTFAKLIQKAFVFSKEIKR